MILFNHPIGVCRNSDDTRVLFVGVICAMVIFTLVSAYDSNLAIAAIQVDYSPVK